MVYALIYTLFLGFGLQIGSDFYLLVDHGARRHLETLAARMNAVVSVSGVFVSDNSSSYTAVTGGKPVSGTFTFSSSVPFAEEHINNGCYRPPSFPWYLQPFPWWTQFIIVPIFSTLSSLANQQPLFTIELVVMVVISCVAYAANKVADHYIFNRSDVVSAIGAFAVGLLGNIYSRKMGGTAFTSMVTGVLFLVPVRIFPHSSAVVIPLTRIRLPTVWTIADRRHYCSREWYRHRRGHDRRDYWNYGGPFHEPGSRVYVRFAEERSPFRILDRRPRNPNGGMLGKTLYVTH